LGLHLPSSDTAKQNGPSHDGGFVIVRVRNPRSDLGHLQIQQVGEVQPGQGGVALKKIGEKPDFLWLIMRLLYENCHLLGAIFRNTEISGGRKKM